MSSPSERVRVAEPERPKRITRPYFVTFEAPLRGEHANDNDRTQPLESQVATSDGEP